MKRPYEFTTIFRQPGPLSVSGMLMELHSIRQELKLCSPLLDGWLLKGNTKAEAHLYEVFEPAGPTAAACAVLNESLKDVVDPKIVSMWNGREGVEGASLQYVARTEPDTSMVVLRAKPAAFSEAFEPVLKLMLKAFEVLAPVVISLETSSYFDKKVFKDRPGVGWMLYLPLVLTVRQIPEARALVPVMGKDANGSDKQIGTVIVSVTEGAFSDDNAEHVRIANAIEIRLVDQDLLPRYADL